MCKCPIGLTPCGYWIDVPFMLSAKIVWSLPSFMRHPSQRSGLSKVKEVLVFELISWLENDLLSITAPDRLEEVP